MPPPNQAGRKTSFAAPAQPDPLAVVGSGGGRRGQRSAAVLLLCAAALYGLRGFEALGRQIFAAPPMCAGAAAPPLLIDRIAAERIVLLTSAVEPLRSEQFFCLQQRVLPRIVRRPPLDDDGRVPLGFAPGVAALTFAGSDAELDSMRTRLALEASPASVERLGGEGGWTWFEAPPP